MEPKAQCPWAERCRVPAPRARRLDRSPRRYLIFILPLKGSLRVSLKDLQGLVFSRGALIITNTILGGFLIIIIV